MSQVKEHIKEAHTDHRYQCDQCDYSVKTKSGMDYHVKSKHRKEKSHVCSWCQKRFNKLMELKRHVHKEHERQEDLLVCDVCAKEFVCKTHLNHHMRCHELRMYGCLACGKGFKTKCNLKDHEKRQSCKKIDKYSLLGDVLYTAEANEGDEAEEHDANDGPKSEPMDP